MGEVYALKRIGLSTEPRGILDSRGMQGYECCPSMTNWLSTDKYEKSVNFKVSIEF